MKQIAILANNNSISSDVFALLDYFEYCNVLWALQQPEAVAPLFHCYLVSPDGQPLSLKPGVQLLVQPHAWQQADALILPAACVVLICRWRRKAPRFSKLFGKRCRPSHLAKPAATAPLPPRSRGPRRCAPSAQPMAPTRLPSSFPAIV